MADQSGLPAGFSLDADERILRTGKDWGVTTRPLLLTTERLVCPFDPSGGGSVAIRLSDVRVVRLRKPFLGFNTVVIEYGEHGRAAFAAHINGALIRADIADAVATAQQAAAPRLSVVRPEPSRYDRLRQIGELKEKGVLTEAEFEEEKARILKEP